MRNIPINQASWSKFVTFFPTEPPVPKKAIFVAEQLGTVEVLAAGVCVIDTDGPYILFESFGVNPELPIVTRHKAAVAVMVAIKGMCTLHAKMGIALAGPSSIVSILKRIGYTSHPNVKVLTFLPRAVGVPAPAGEKRDTDPAPPPPAVAAPELQDEPEDNEGDEELDPFLETEEPKARKVKRRTLKKKR